MKECPQELSGKAERQPTAAGEGVYSGARLCELIAELQQIMGCDFEQVLYRTRSAGILSY